MDLSLFITCLLVAMTGPVIAIRYLRPILLRVLWELCPSEAAAAFWLRCSYLLAVCGSVVLMLLWGDFSPNQPPVLVLRRTLLLLAGGIFVSVAFISRNVWLQVRTASQAAALREDSAQGGSI